MDEIPSATVVSKLHRNILPLFVAVVCCCYLDRTSLAFAALQLCQQPWFNPATFGFGSGIFYLGYVVCQVPSNLVLRRLGAPLWLGVIITAWGVVAACCASISSTVSFYSLRLILGITEAGAFPGMWYVLAHFYPQQYITVPYAVLEASIAISQVIAAPVAAAILQLDGLAGLQGWQWLFITEGCVTVILGIILYIKLPLSITTAGFLTPDEKLWLQQQHTGHRSQATMVPPLPQSPDSGGPSSALKQQEGASALSQEPRHHHRASTMELLIQTFRTPSIWYLSLIKILKDVSLDGLLYWSPTLMHSLVISGQVDFSNSSRHQASACSGHSSSPAAVLLTAVPFTVAACTTVAIGHSSEKRREQRWHISLPLIIGGCIFALMPVLVQVSVVLGFLCLTVALVSADATTGPFWTWVQGASQGETIAVSLALVNSLGKIGGFFGPYMFGLLVHWTGSYMSSVFLISGALLGGGLLAWRYPHGSVQPHRYSQLQEAELVVQ